MLASPPRLLVVTNMWPTPTRPYLGVFTERQVDGLREAGVQATVIAIDGERRFEYLKAAGRVLALNRGPRRFDLIHAHTGHCGVLACLQLRYPVVMSYVGYDLDADLGEAETTRTTVERLVFRGLSLFLAATIAKSARGRRHIPRGGRGRNTLVPNGVDRDLFAPVPRTEARRRLGWDHDDPVVVFAADPARLEKCFDLARSSVDIARRQAPALRLEVAGDVHPRDMALWYSAADVLLLTSHQEGSPNVVKEAMSCDLPVVSVEVGDVREVIEGTSLCHVCARHPEALAAALLDVIAALPARSNGRERTAWLASSAISSRLLEVYGRARGRGPGALGCLRRRS